jgi:hypothetical protein
MGCYPGVGLAEARLAEVRASGQSHRAEPAVSYLALDLAEPGSGIDQELPDLELPEPELPGPQAPGPESEVPGLNLAAPESGRESAGQSDLAPDHAPGAPRRHHRAGWAAAQAG